MKRVILSTVPFGTKVKLTPQGKVYTVFSSNGFGKDIYLEDKAGKLFSKPYNLSVYVKDTKE